MRRPSAADHEPHGFVPSRLSKELSEVPLELARELSEIWSEGSANAAPLPSSWSAGAPATVAYAYLSETARAGATEVKLNFVTRGPPGHVQSLHGRRLRLQFAVAWTAESVSDWDDELDGMSLSVDERDRRSTWKHSDGTSNVPFNRETVEVRQHASGRDFRSFKLARPLRHTHLKSEPVRPIAVQPSRAVLLKAERATEQLRRQLRSPLFSLPAPVQRELSRLLPDGFMEGMHTETGEAAGVTPAAERSVELRTRISVPVLDSTPPVLHRRWKMTPRPTQPVAPVRGQQHLVNRAHPHAAGLELPCSERSPSRSPSRSPPDSRPASPLCLLAGPNHGPSQRVVLKPTAVPRLEPSTLCSRPTPRSSSREHGRESARSLARSTTPRTARSSLLGGVSTPRSARSTRGGAERNAERWRAASMAAAHSLDSARRGHRDGRGAFTGALAATKPPTSAPSASVSVVKV